VVVMMLEMVALKNSDIRFHLQAIPSRMETQIELLLA
jgi:hypothetical protein